MAWHVVTVEHRPDLDQVAALISRHAADWERAGLAVGPLTWRDAGMPWPYQLKADRNEVADADSVGISVRKQQQKGRLVTSAAAGPTWTTGPAYVPTVR